MSYLDDDVDALVSLVSRDPEPLLREMEAHATDLGFPIVGPAVGRTLRVLARLGNARRVFEFGSGFGYSAAWFVGALPSDGEIVLTEVDPEEMAEAEAFLDEASLDPTFHFEVGDANDIVERYDGPFDAVLIDHDKTTYTTAFERVREKLAPGGVIVADNVLSGPVEPGNVRAALEGDAPADDLTAGVAAYVERVRDDPAFETTLIPLGEGIAVSVLQK